MFDSLRVVTLSSVTSAKTNVVSRVHRRPPLCPFTADSRTIQLSLSILGAGYSISWSDRVYSDTNGVPPVWCDSVRLTGALLKNIVHPRLRFPHEEYLPHMCFSFCRAGLHYDCRMVWGCRRLDRACTLDRAVSGPATIGLRVVVSVLERRSPL